MREQVKALAVGWGASMVTGLLLWVFGVPGSVVAGGVVSACAYWYGVSVGGKGMYRRGYLKGYGKGREDAIRALMV